MSTAFRAIEIPAGVVSKATKKMNSSNYAEVNLVRWREGQLSPMGGQSQFAYTFASRCKKIHGWYGLDQVFHIAYLCETNLYVDTGGALTDITPAGGLAPLPMPAAGGYGDGLYNQGLQLKTTAAFTTASPNITMVANTGAQPGMDVFNVTKGLHVGTVLTYVGTALVLTANASSAGSSGDVLNFGAYNQPRAISISQALDRVPNAFSLDNFGAILYAMTSPDGRLLKWDPAVGGAAIVQPPDSGRGPVPTGRCFVVTPERFILVFGAYDATNGGGFRRFAWCDQENPGAWDYASVTSQAGYLDIEPASPIICAMSTRSGTLFWTGKKCYISRFLGSPYIYNYTELADSTTPWSSQSMVNTSSMAVWMGEQGPFSFDGTSVLPVQCMVRSWVDDDIDILYVREMACLVHVENYNEVWWFFPQGGKTGNTRAIIYNYKEGWWGQARMARSAGVSAAYNVHTIMANGTLAYKHEDGVSYSNDATLPFAETFGLNIVSGSRLVTIKQLLPDIEGAASSIQYRLFYRNSRVDLTDPVTGFPVNPEQVTSPSLVRPNGFVDFRTTGRDVRLRMEVIGPSVLPFTLGAHLIDIVARGDR